MGIDYRIQIRRKCDDKQIGEFIANHLKNILDSKFSDIINCSSINCNNSKFTISDLHNLQNQVFDKIKQLNSQIVEKKLMIACCKSSEVKEYLEADIFSIQNDLIEECKHVLASAYEIDGMIQCLVEDMLDGNSQPAYENNGRDLPKETYSYGDGKTYESNKSIWTEDVYCIVKADY